LDQFDSQKLGHIDRVLGKTNGIASGVNLSVYPSTVIYNAAIKVDVKHFDVNMIHEMMGHCDTVNLQKIANIHGFKSMDNVEVFHGRALATASQKNVNKELKVGSQVPGERIYLASLRGEINLWRCKACGPNF
jgi:hypothetical protein